MDPYRDSPAYHVFLDGRVVTKRRRQMPQILRAASLIGKRRNQVARVSLVYKPGVTMAKIYLFNVPEINQAVNRERHA